MAPRWKHARYSARYGGIVATVLEYPAVARTRVVQIWVFPVVTSLKPDSGDGNDCECTGEDYDHNYPFPVAIPPGIC